MDEFELIRRYFDRRLADDRVRTGIGDDGAVLDPLPDRNLVAVVDTLIEGVHFPADLLPADVGYRSVAVNLSDLAAMGARPRWMTLALTLDHADEDWLRSFAGGIFEAASEHNVSLVGGDTTQGPGKIITIQALGDVPRALAICRSGARPGDAIYVSGTIGDAAAGLSLMQNSAVESADRRFLLRRFARPEARVSLGVALRGTASAAIDLSDGLFADLAKLLDQSGAAGDLQIDAIPLSPALTGVYGDDDAVQFALAGGDDYELCFTVPAAEQDTVSRLSSELGLPVSRIGTVAEGRGLRCLREGKEYAFDDPGFRHF